MKVPFSKFLIFGLLLSYGLAAASSLSVANGSAIAARGLPIAMRQISSVSVIGTRSLTTANDFVNEVRGLPIAVSQVVGIPDIERRSPNPVRGEDLSGIELQNLPPNSKSGSGSKKSSPHDTSRLADKKGKSPAPKPYKGGFQQFGEPGSPIPHKVQDHEQFRGTSSLRGKFPDKPHSDKPENATPAKDSATKTKTQPTNEHPEGSTPKGSDSESELEPQKPDSSGDSTAANKDIAHEDRPASPEVDDGIEEWLMLSRNRSKISNHNPSRNPSPNLSFSLKLSPKIRNWKRPHTKART